MAAGKIRMKIGPRSHSMKQEMTLARELITVSINSDNIEQACMVSNRLDKHIQIYTQLLDDLQETEKDISDTLAKEVEERYTYIIEAETVRSDLYTKIEIYYKKCPTNILNTNEINRNTESNVRLPKIEVKKFTGDIFTWHSFWDAFEVTIHNNKTLSEVEKLHYLKTYLEKEPANLLSGYELTKENYNTCIDILKERYAKKQIIIHAHYNKLMKLSIPPNPSTIVLRQTFNEVETHLRALENLGQVIESQVIVSMILGKLPPSLVNNMADKNFNNQWTVQFIRQHWKRYIENKEFTESTSGACNDKNKFQNSQSEPVRFSTESLLIKENRKFACIYCGGNHYNDECTKYKTVTERKNKIRGHCFSCLKKGHALKECRNKKKCVYCAKEGFHHRSLCIDKFPVGKQYTEQKKIAKCSGKSENTLHAAETNQVIELSDVTDNKTEQTNEVNMLSYNEQVIMQTATLKAGPILKNRSQFEKQAVKTRIMLDGGSHRTYISEAFAKHLCLEPNEDNTELSVYRFGSAKPKTVKTTSVNLGIQLKDGSIMEISANVVPKITGTIQRTSLPKPLMIDASILADDLPKNEHYKLDLLIGNDYYWELFNDEVTKQEISPGLYIVSSKLGYLLTGRTNSSDSYKSQENLALFVHTDSNLLSNLSSFIHTNNNNASIEDMWKLETLGIKDDPMKSDDEYALEDFSRNITYQNGRYEVSLP